LRFFNPAAKTYKIEPKHGRENAAQATRWLSWYGVGLASADRLPVVARILAGPLGSLKCDPPKGNGRRPKKKKVGKMLPRLKPFILI